MELIFYGIRHNRVCSRASLAIHLRPAQTILARLQFTLLYQIVRYNKAGRVLQFPVLLMEHVPKSNGIVTALLSLLKAGMISIIGAPGVPLLP